MPFSLTEDQDMIRNMVRDFVKREVEPVAEKLDHERAFPREVLAKAAGLGLLGMLVTAEKGGAGTDTVSFAVAVEEVARASGTTALALSVQNALVAFPLAFHGASSDAATTLGKVVGGESLGAWALTEPGAGSDVSATRTRARTDGDDVVLSGLKSFVVGAPAADAFLVTAREDEGLSVFLVPGDADGLAVGPPERSMTLRGSDMAQVFLKDVRVPATARVGDAGAGGRVAAESLALARLAGAAMAVGLMQGSLDESIEYAGQRTQFRQPIKNFQAIQWNVADMDARTRAARTLTHVAAASRDDGRDWLQDLAAAKITAGESAKWVTQQGIRIHGGAGFMRDAPLERFNRDARAMSVFAGTTEIARSEMAGRLLEL